MRKTPLIALPFTALMLAATTGVAEAAPGIHPLTITPSSNLTNGQSVKISSSGWPAGANVIVIECADLTGGASSCDTGHIASATIDGQGNLSTTFAVRTGAIGNKVCAPGSQCYIAVSTPSQSDVGTGPIRFKSAAVAAATPTATPTAGSTHAPQATASAAPVTVGAGSGGTSDRTSLPILPVTAGLAGLVLAGVGVRFLRR